jgi:hypothetical protein
VSGASNITLERTEGSRALAPAAQRERYPDFPASQ